MILFVSGLRLFQLKAPFLPGLHAHDWLSCGDLSGFATGQPVDVSTWHGEKCWILRSSMFSTRATIEVADELYAALYPFMSDLAIFNASGKYHRASAMRALERLP